MTQSEERYTGQILVNDQVVETIIGHDLDKLKAKLLVSLNNEYNSGEGKIIDNMTGEVIHRCRRTAPD